MNLDELKKELGKEAFKKVPYCLFTEKMWLKAREVGFCDFTDEEFNNPDHGVFKYGPLKDVGWVLMTIDPLMPVKSELEARYK